MAAKTAKNLEPAQDVNGPRREVARIESQEKELNVLKQRGNRNRSDTRTRVQ